MHEQLYGDPASRHFLVPASTDLLLTPYQGRPIFGEDYHHLQAEDGYSPILREMAYVLCDNRLMLHGGRVVSRNGLLPVMPRYRLLGNDSVSADMHWEGNAYCWHSIRRPLRLQSATQIAQADPTEPRWLLVKTWGEFIDHLLTRKSTIKTDLFIYPVTEQPDTIRLCGLAREFTSTNTTLSVRPKSLTVAAAPCRNPRFSGIFRVPVYDSVLQSASKRQSDKVVLRNTPQSKLRHTLAQSSIRSWLV